MERVKRIRGEDHWIWRTRRVVQQQGGGTSEENHSHPTGSGQPIEGHTSVREAK